LSPLEVAQSIIQRIEEVNPHVRAWAHLNFEYLLQVASAATAGLARAGSPRALEGVALGVKDVFNTTHFPTQMGSAIWGGFNPGNNARVLDSALYQGALLPGKTQTAELSVHALSETINPFSTERSPGTSSSGSAVAVATRMVPTALGTQSAGSISRPASFCGIFGMKPSFGLLPRTGVLKTADTLDTIGFLTSHLCDLRLLLQSLRVRGSNHPLVAKYVDAPRQDVEGRPWKVAFVRDLSWHQADPEVTAAANFLVDRVRQLDDVDVIDVALPESIEAGRSVHDTLYAKSLSYYFRQEAAADTERLSPVLSDLIRRGRGISLQSFDVATQAQEDIAASLNDFLTPFDCFISLATTTAAPLRHETERDDPCLLWTLSHIPTVVVPNGLSSSGLPIGIQFGAKKFDDFRLLNMLEHLAAADVVAAEARQPRMDSIRAASG
jgi:Asp-tRNA(Asn)/Glu-tRNA(Gln) amidotransferase A subunit family amidase